MLAFSKVIQPKTVAEAYEAAVKNKMAPLLAGGCWIRLGRRIWPVVIDLSDKVGLPVYYSHKNQPVQAELDTADEALEALVALGYSLADATKALEGVDVNLSTSQRVTEALKK